MERRVLFTQNPSVFNGSVKSDWVEISPTVSLNQNDSVYYAMKRYQV